MSKKLIYLVSFVLMLSLVLTNIGNAAEKTHLIGWWKYDGDTLDYSGLGNDGTAVGNPTFVRGTFRSYALDLDGDDYVTMDGVADDITDNDITLSAWVKTTDNNADWFSCNTGTGGNVVRFCIQAGKAAFDTNSEHALSTTKVSDGQWHLLTFIRSGSTGYVYVDGVQENSYTADFNFSADDRWSIGQEWDTDSPSDFLTGIVDDARIYDRILSAALVQDLLNGIAPAFVKAENPKPANGVVHPDTWVTLRWSPGDTAASHDVYFGDNFGDVNDGTGQAPRGNHPSTLFVAGFTYPDGFAPGTTYYWRIDEVEADGTTIHKGDVWSFTTPSAKAHNPDPADSGNFADPNVELSWKAGLSAKLHTVYFGNNFADVNNAAGGLLQGTTTYTPGPLELDKTYYWRVDEFDGVATHKGDVWSFKTLPVMHITDLNLVGWWKLDEGMGTLALDWSGHGNHGILKGDPEWIADGYDSGALNLGSGNYVAIQNLHYNSTGYAEVSVCAWIRTVSSGNQIIASYDRNQFWRLEINGSGGGPGQVGWDVMTSSGQVDYGSSTRVDDGLWHHICGVFDNGRLTIYIDGLPEASASGGNTFGTNATRYGFIGVGSEAGEFDGNTGTNNFVQGDLDNVRIYDKALTREEIALAMRGDPLLAWGPKPCNGTTLYIRNATPLSWLPGDKASGHDVYFGTDIDAVNNADTSDATGIYRGQQIGIIYTPPEGVEWGGGPYYWRVDERNTDATVTRGEIWSFKVADYLLVDDFEDYNDYEPERIFDTWIDGWGVAINGSTICYAEPDFSQGEHFVETTIVHGGVQSMPYFYDTNFKYSETSRMLVSAHDWTEEGVGVLSLWFRGNSDSAAAPMYVALNGSVAVSHDNPNAAQIDSWTEWNINLKAFAAQGVNLADVDTITIGFGDKNHLQAGGSGVVYFDDIRLYRPAPEPEPAP